MEEKMTQKRSLILQYFTPDLLTKLWLITKTSGASNNEKGQLVKETLRENNVAFSPLGSGTNRLGILIDGYSFKIALDEDGMIDNRREFLYTTKLQPYVIKVYEISPMGLIAVSEYFTLFTYDDYREHAEEMKDILKIVSRSFLIGDVGVTGKNYVNWGFREDGTIGMLDFAYIYSVDYKLFTCSCSDDAILVYDDDFVKLVCPQCGRKYTFGSIRKKVTKKQQEEEKVLLTVCQAVAHKEKQHSSAKRNEHEQRIIAEHCNSRYAEKPYCYDYRIVFGKASHSSYTSSRSCPSSQVYSHSILSPSESSYSPQLRDGVIPLT